MGITPEHDLEKDLHMTNKMKVALNESVVDMFNGRQLNFSSIHNVQDIVEQIINTEPNHSIH